MQVRVVIIRWFPHWSAMPFHPLERQENMHNGYRKTFQLVGVSLLLLQVTDKAYLIENRCGHFGMPLEEGRLEDSAIVCPQHGISFSLETGAIVNRPYENADPVRTFDITIRDGVLGVDL